jgi:N-carbamoyl-L-amino-acid hydrolase
MAVTSATGMTAPVNGERLWRSLMDMGRIGTTAGGGVGRIALTDLDKAGRDLFAVWCRDAGLTVRVDRMGNIIGRRAGADDTAPPVVTGSHLDSQPLGGKFDGAYGVLAGLEVVRALNDAGVTTRAPLEIIDWTDEEGVRFAAGVVASGVYAGRFDLDYGRNLADREGTTTMGRELARIGYDGDAPCGGYPISAFFEAHIEQGPVLEREGAVIGAVLGAQGQRCYAVTVTGEEGHAGTLPMALRRDALVGAARMIDGLNRLTFDFDPMPVLTTGYVQVRPNSRNTVPGRVTFSIDVRHPDNALLADICARADTLCHRVAEEAGLAVEMVETSGRDSIAFDPGCIDAVRVAAKKLGLTCRDIHSGAGHDACNLARRTPTGMIFVPCKDGISHNEREAATPDDLAAGCQVLLEVMVARAGIA